MHQTHNKLFGMAQTTQFRDPHLPAVVPASNVVGSRLAFARVEVEDDEVNGPRNGDPHRRRAFKANVSNTRSMCVRNGLPGPVEVTST